MQLAYPYYGPVNQSVLDNWHLRASQINFVAGYEQ